MLFCMCRIKKKEKHPQAEKYTENQFRCFCALRRRPNRGDFHSGGNHEKKTRPESENKKNANSREIRQNKFFLIVQIDIEIIYHRRILTPPADKPPILKCEKHNFSLSVILLGSQNSDSMLISARQRTANILFVLILCRVEHSLLWLVWLSLSVLNVVWLMT